MAMRAWLAEGERGRWRAIHDRSLEIGNSYEFKRYPDYWFDPENGIKPIDTFVWRIVFESSTKRIAMEDGRGPVRRLVTPRIRRWRRAAGS